LGPFPGGNISKKKGMRNGEGPEKPTPRRKKKSTVPAVSFLESGNAKKQTGIMEVDSLQRGEKVPENLVAGKGKGRPDDGHKNTVQERGSNACLERQRSARKPEQKTTSPGKKGKGKAFERAGWKTGDGAETYLRDGRSGHSRR